MATLIGDQNDNTLSGTSGNDTISGLGGNDFIYGNMADDLIYGNQGDDQIFGGQGNDTALGGQGNDTLYGNQGNDVAYGNLGNDIVYGNQGNDVLYGGQGNDTLYGGQGDDILVGGVGDNVLVGGQGNDTAVFAGTRASYTITQDAAGDFILSGADGIDTVSTVENFQFSDGTVAAANLIQGTSGGGGNGGGGGGVEPTRPTPEPDTYVATDTTDGQITFVPSILANDTPQGNGLEVASVTNASVTLSNGQASPLTPVMAQQGQVANYEFDGGAGIDDLIINENGSVSVDINERIPLGEQIIFNFDYSDENANGISPTSAHVSATVTSSETAPVVTTSGGILNYTDQSTQPIDNDVTVTDADGNNLTAATVQITNNFQPGEDVLGLGINDSSGAPFTISATADGDGYHQILNPGYTTDYVMFGPGTVMFKGLDTHQHYEDLLDAVTYTDTSDTPSTVPRTVTFTGVDEDGNSSAGSNDTIDFEPIASSNNYGVRAAGQATMESEPSSDNSHVLAPDAGHQTITNFIAGGPAHHSLSIQGADFGNDTANVLNHTHNVQGGVVINDPTTQDKIFLSDIHKGQLAANTGDFTFNS